MRCTQLSCPYCGSLLSFGQEVPAGTDVPCLICDRTFTATGVTVSEAPPPPVAAVPEPPPVVLESVAEPVPPEPPPLELLAAPAEPPPAALVPLEVPAEPPPIAAVVAPPPFPEPVVRSEPPPLTVAAPAASPAQTGPLILGGIVLAGMTLILIGGLALVLWNLFHVVPPGADAAQAAGPGNAAPAGVTADKAGAASPAGEVDLADLKKPDAPPPTGPLTDKFTKPGGDTVPVPVVPVAIDPGNPAGLDQQRIDAAIAKGVAYLKTHQLADGSWRGGHDVGYAAIAGLTLLECQVPANDPAVQKAARFVRGNVARLNKTYELSLAILFLDRLGNPRDRVTIQGLALRLLAGQDDTGGWTYHCPLLSPPEMQQLLVFLQSHRPRVPALPKVIRAPADPLKQVQGGPDDPFQQLDQLLMKLPKMVQDPNGETQPDPKHVKVNKPADPQPLDKTAKSGKGTAKKLHPVPPQHLPFALQKLPVVQLTVNKRLTLKGRTGGGDHSNTQFALLALWAARRHDVPTEYTLKQSYQRFMVSQNADGGWGYHMGTWTTPTMTGVGLLGLAVGHGALPDAARKDDKAKLESPAIQNGLRALGRSIGTPSKDAGVRPPMQNLYFLWSVDRVAMLYDLKTIGGKDWYGWGAQILVANQQANGSWVGGQYPGSAAHTDTCFALLFLKRSNLVPDLTENLRLHMAIRDPEVK